MASSFCYIVNGLDFILPYLPNPLSPFHGEKGSQDKARRRDLSAFRVCQRIFRQVLHI